MFADEVFALRLGLPLERIIGCAHVGELGVAALGRDAAGVQQRIFGGYHLEGAVGVPEPVPDGEEPSPILPSERLVVLVEVGYVGEGRGEAILVSCAQPRADGFLELAQAPREGELPCVVDELVVE